jgi:hypothetical protein
MIELTYQGAAILGVIAVIAWIAIWWTDRPRPPRAGE